MPLYTSITQDEIRQEVQLPLYTTSITQDEIRGIGESRGLAETYNVVYDVVGYDWKKCPFTYDVACFLHIVYGILLGRSDLRYRIRHRMLGTLARLSRGDACLACHHNFYPFDIVMAF